MQDLPVRTPACSSLTVLSTCSLCRFIITTRDGESSVMHLQLFVNRRDSHPSVVPRWQHVASVLDVVCMPYQGEM